MLARGRGVVEQTEGETFVRQFLAAGKATGVHSFHTTDDLWAKVGRIAEANGVSMSDVVREALEALPEPGPTVIDQRDCPICRKGVAVVLMPDASLICLGCWKKEKPVTKGWKLGISGAVAAVVIGLFSIFGRGEAKPRLVTVPPTFGYADSGQVVFKPYLIRNAGGGKLWGSIRKAPSCGPDYLIQIPGHGEVLSVHYILGRGETFRAVIRYGPKKDGAQVCAFTVGQGGDK